MTIHKYDIISSFDLYIKTVDFLKENGSITSLDAIKEIGCLRLASRIVDLKKLGYNIKSKTEFSVNRYGEKIHY